MTTRSNAFEKVRIVRLFGAAEVRSRGRAHRAVERLLTGAVLEGQGQAPTRGLGRPHARRLAPKDVLAIWKGLYTWLWMQDKPLLHEQVVHKICALLPRVTDDALALEFIRAFFVTFEREWPRIDTHRVDKFYMLTRDFFQAQLRWLQDKQGEIVEQYLAMLGAALSHQVASVACPGLTLHFYDLFIDELLKTTDGRSTALTTDLVVRAVLPVLGVCRHQLIIDRINKAVLGPLDNLAATGKLQLDLVRVGRELLAGTASSDLRAKTRKMMYYFANKFLRSKGQTDEEKQQETDQIIDVQMDKDCNDKPTEPVSAATEQQLSQKKNKKGKKKRTRDIEPIVDVPMEIESCHVTGEAAAVATEQQSPVDEMVNVSNKDENNTALVEDHKMDIDLPDQYVVATPKKSQNGKMKKSKKIETNKGKLKTTETSSNGDADKRVTFGKKYTKKFSDASVSVALSQGSVKQTQVKSILKRK